MKQEGNEFFSQGKYQEAYDIYTEALTIDPRNKSTNAKLYYNRAVVGSKVMKLMLSGIILLDGNKSLHYSTGVSLIEEIGRYRILNRQVPLRFIWFTLFSELTS